MLKLHLDQILSYAREHVGPMIICGDFNTWSGKRMTAIHRFAAELDLVQPLAVGGKGGRASAWFILLKPFLSIDFGAELDHVFCRGLEITAFDRLIDFDSSDHHPLLLKVRIRSNYFRK